MDLDGPAFLASMSTGTAAEQEDGRYGGEAGRTRRFHARGSTVRWNAAWIMPKHVLRPPKQKDPTSYDFFSPPVRDQAPSTLKSFDPNGGWLYLAEA